MKRHIKRLYGCVMSLVYKIIYWSLCNLPVFKLYQPVYGCEKSSGLTRSCQDRWDVFSKHLPENKGSFLDIGCNIGYFSFRAAHEGHYAYGVEADHFNFTSCNAIRQAKGVKNAVFVKQMIDPEFVKAMPHFDTVINLSVFHHWVKVYGVDEAKAMMKALAQKCNTLIFETGQSNEVGSQWPEILSFMGDKPDVWIEGFLKELGFADVKMIGTFATGLTNVDRYLFAATK